MRLPESVRVGHLDLRVEPMTRLDRDAIGEGVCSTRSEMILVDTDQTGTNQLEVLLHEVSHAINRIAAIDDDSSEEQQVLRTTPLWLMVWRDNPSLLDLLVSFCRQ